MRLGKVKQQARTASGELTGTKHDNLIYNAMKHANKCVTVAKVAQRFSRMDMTNVLHMAVPMERHLEAMVQHIALPKERHSEAVFQHKILLRKRQLEFDLLLCSDRVGHDGQESHWPHTYYRQPAGSDD